MLAIVLICVAVSAAFVLLFLVEVAPGRNPIMAQRLAEMQATDRVLSALCILCDHATNIATSSYIERLYHQMKKTYE